MITTHFGAFTFESIFETLIESGSANFIRTMFDEHKMKRTWELEDGSLKCGLRKLDLHDPKNTEVAKKIFEACIITSTCFECWFQR